jgi:2,3-dihydroxyethylbenzene 1,2-dioxygenase
VKGRIKRKSAAGGLKENPASIILANWLDKEEETMGINQLGYVGLSVSDIAAWEEFATEVLGMEVSDRRTDGSMYLRMDNYHHRFILHPTGKDDIAYTGWGAPNEVEFEEMKQRMVVGGLPFSQATPEELDARMVADMVRFKVAGIPHELYFGLRVPGGRAFRPGRAMMGTFKTGELGLGHIGFPLEDAEEIKGAAHVFQDILGFKTSEWIGETPFFHINPRQHSLTFPPRAGFGGARRAPETDGKLIGHFALEVTTLDDVATCLDICYERGIPNSGVLNKRVTDNGISFRMTSPSGFPVEYDWGDLLVDDSTWHYNTYDSTNISAWGQRRGMLMVNTNRPEEVDRAIKTLTELRKEPAQS